MKADYRWNKGFFDAVIEVNTSSSAYSYSTSCPLGTAGQLSCIERELLGPLTGVRLLQFMSHLGAESTAIAALGASVTGIDLNPHAVAQARRRAASLESQARFLEGDCLDADNLVPRGSFDMVYIGLGSLGWTHDLRTLFAAAYHCLKPGGSIRIFEVHPVAQAASTAEKSRDARANGYRVTDFEVPVECSYRTSWTGDSGQGRVERFFIWRHRTCDIVQALIDVGFDLRGFNEHQTTTYKQFEDMTIQPNGMWGYATGGNVPLTLSIDAVKGSVAQRRQRMIVPPRRP